MRVNKVTENAVNSNLERLDKDIVAKNLIVIECE